MNSKIIATIVIISMFAGFAALVGQISQQASAASIPCDSKGSSGQGATHCDFGGGCKLVITPSGQSNTNSKCR
jgi:hypothetical protein